MVSGSPVGSTPFGLSTPVAAPEPSTAGPALSRYINPGSGEYELDVATGQFAFMPSVRQRVLLIGKTELGSSTALPELGIRRPKKIDESFRVKIEAEIRRAFKRLTDVERVIQITSIDVEKISMGRVGWTMNWIDLTAIDPNDRAQVYTGAL